MIFTTTDDASKPTTPRTKYNFRKLSNYEMENAILMATHDLIEDLRDKKIQGVDSIKGCFNDKLTYHTRTMAVARPALKSYREVMKMNWAEFTAYVVDAARYICYSEGGTSTDVSGVARKLYSSGIKGVSQCVGQDHRKRPAFKYFNDMYLHEIYTGAVNTTIHTIVEECDRKIKEEAKKARKRMSKAIPKMEPALYAAQPETKQPPKFERKIPVSPSPAPIATVIQSKAPMVSAPAK